MTLIHRAPDDPSRFAQALRILRQAQTSDKRLRDVWSLLPSFGDNLMGKITRRYVQHEEPILFGLMQAGTNVLWHDQKQTASNWKHNDQFVSRLSEYSERRAG